MKYVKITGTGLTCIGFLYLIVHWIGGKTFGISDAGMRLFLKISLASLVTGYALLLWYTRNDKKQFRRLLVLILFTLLIVLGITGGAYL